MLEKQNLNCDQKELYNRFASLLIDWYKRHHRALPWRQTRNPYHIWLSEVILQQTRVRQGVGYYERFLAAFPDVASLAAAPLDQVLRMWQGLGYYTRARNLHATACLLVKDYEGKLPESYAALRRLKGIGDYTAAAIASFAYDEPVAVVDGNVCRVLTRLFGIEKDIRQSGTRKEIKQLSQALMPTHQAAIYNQAIMEFGALHCTPRNPACGICIFRDMCYAARHQKQMQLPRKSQSKSKRIRYLSYRWLYYEGEVWLRQRMADDIWQGLYEPLLIEAPTQTLLQERIHMHPLGELWLQAQYMVELRHELTHQTLYIDMGWLELAQKPSNIGGYWFKLPQLEALPKPVIIAKYIEQYMQNVVR